MDRARAEQAIRELLAAVGEDPEREGLRDTPQRVAEAYEHLFSGLREDPVRHLEVTFSEEACDPVLLRDVPLGSLCEHHLLPMIGSAHIAYLPAGKVVGFSEIVALAEGYARRPQIQERLTTQIADALHDGLGSAGSLVVLEMTQTCMTMRGAEKPGTTAVTSAARGVFERDTARRAEVVALMRGGA